MSKIWPHNIVDSSQFDSHKNDFTLQIPYGGTTTNVGNAYEIATPVIPALTEGMAVCVKINTDSTGAATLNWAGTGDKNIVTPDGGAVINLKNDGIYTFRYDGVSYILQNIDLDLSAHLAEDASLTVKGHVQLQTTVDTSESKALTPKALNNHLTNVVTDNDGAHGLKIESGTWTPVLVGTTTAGTNTYSTQIGQYHKIGSLVFISGRLWLSAKDAAMAGNIAITSLPFAAASAAAVTNAQWANLDLNASTPQLTPIVYSGETRIRLSTSGDNIGANWIDQKAISASTGIDFSCVYKTS